jgi:hypothetical protein
MPSDPYPPSPAARAAGRSRLDAFLDQETQKLLRPGESVLHAAQLTSMLLSPQAVALILFGAVILGVPLVALIAAETEGHPSLMLPLVAVVISILVVVPLVIALATRTFYLAAVTRRRILLIRVPQGLLSVRAVNMGTEEIPLRDILAMGVEDGFFSHRLDLVFGPDRKRVFHLSRIAHPVSGQEELLDFAASYHRGVIDVA